MSVQQFGKAGRDDNGQRGEYLGYLTVSVTAKDVMPVEMAAKVEALQDQIAGLVEAAGLSGVINVHPLEEC